MVGCRGVEPRTCWLRVRCSTNWANSPFFSECKEMTGQLIAYAVTSVKYSSVLEWNSLIEQRWSCVFLHPGQFLATHIGEVFTLTFIYKGAGLFHKPAFFGAPKSILKGFVTALLGQEFSLFLSVVDVLVLYGKLPNSHTEPPQSVENRCTPYATVSAGQEWKFRGALKKVEEN